MKKSFFLVIFIVATIVQCSTGALTCYACDTDASPNCITDPGDYSSVLCKSTDTHCYTYRIETGTGASITDVTVDRGCCEVKDNSPICPLGPDFQIDETAEWTRFMSRCETDLCNDSEGDAGEGGGDSGGCCIVLPGNPSSSTRGIPSGKGISLILAVVYILNHYA